MMLTPLHYTTCIYDANSIALYCRALSRQAHSRYHHSGAALTLPSPLTQTCACRHMQADRASPFANQGLQGSPGSVRGTASARQTMSPGAESEAGCPSTKSKCMLCGGTVCAGPAFSFSSPQSVELTAIWPCGWKCVDESFILAKRDPCQRCHFMMKGILV